MCLFSTPIPYMEINCAEVLAIHRAISISLATESMKNRQIILESDSSNAVVWCNSECGGPWNMNFHLNFIRNARKRSMNITITHKRRNVNFVADSLAKQGLHWQSKFIAWLLPMAACSQQGCSLLKRSLSPRCNYHVSPLPFICIRPCISSFFSFAKLM